MKLVTIDAEWLQDQINEARKLGSTNISGLLAVSEHAITTCLHPPSIEKTKAVWLNITNGKFSNSWDVDEMKKLLGGMHYEELLLLQYKTEGWKLITYKCINDPSFEFYGIMKLK